MSDSIVGQKIRISYSAADANGVAGDPNTVTLTIKPPVSAQIVATYPGTIVRTGIGKYYYDVPLTESGKWRWGLDTTGALQDAAQGEVLVSPRNI